MERPTAHAARGHRLRGRLRGLGGDYVYVLPGLPLAALSLPLLVGLTAASVGTFVVWVGALLLPLTLLVASGFAGLSRYRLRAWGVPVEPPRFKPAGRGLTGLAQVMTDPRRWLDLVFESLIALPVRAVTFVVAATWTALVVGGLTSWLWSLLLPEDDLGWPLLLRSLSTTVPEHGWGAYLIDSGINLLIGVLALVTLPRVMRFLATLDARLTAALLGGAAAPRDAELAPEGSDRLGGREGAWRPAFDSIGWRWAGVSFLAVVLLAVGWPVLAAVYGLHPAEAMVLAAGQSIAVVLAARWAWPAIGVATAAAAGTVAATYGAPPDAPWPWPVTTLVAHCLFVAVVGMCHRWLRTAAAWTTGAAVTAVTFAVAGQVPEGAPANGVVLVSVSAGLAVLGALGRLWARNAGRAEQAERLSAEEAQRRQDLEERNRIARELHDVVAHSMSVINVQASTAQYRIPGIPADVLRELDDIAASSRQALGEMRALLAILRHGGEEAPTAPEPQLADIPDLVEATRAAGAAIDYSGADGDVPPTVGLTAFRVVQEALSNALRHAPGAAIEVTTAVEGEGVTVRVVNSAAEGGAEPAPGSGLGLAGIRERVTALGGTVEAGPTAEGGFAVVASLPLGADARRR